MTTFEHGTFSCFEDLGLCLVTYFAPCYVAGKNAQFMGNSCCLHGLATFCGFGFISDAIIRQKIREKYGIDGSLVNDIICHCFCPCCALIQEAREVIHKGNDAPPGVQAMARE